LQNKFDSFFTDPPYTIDGLRLFMSRGISALKDEPGLMVFLSFGHKSPNFTLDMHNELNDMGLMICQIIPRFNSYEGAEIIGNTSQMFVIRTTHSTRQSIDFYYGAPIYTGELRKTMRSYKCLSCHLMYKVGEGCSFITIEQLKQNGCTGCGQKLFKLEERINK
jgi:predicted methyltransferase